VFDSYSRSVNHDDKTQAIYQPEMNSKFGKSKLIQMFLVRLRQNFGNLSFFLSSTAMPIIFILIALLLIIYRVTQV
jgi:hypothetical protein